MAKQPTSKEALAKMNEDHVVVQMGGKATIVGWEDRDAGDGRTVRGVVYSSPADLSLIYANRKVAARTKDAEGNETIKYKPLFKYWLEHANRPTAIGVTVDPKGERFVDGRLNLWQGFGVQSKPGEWPLLRRHITEVVCSGNEDHATYFLRYIAWKLQNPTLRNEVIVILRGKQGTGKGTIVTLLCLLFGAHGLQVTNKKHLVGSFNSHLSQVCFLFADEAVWAGDKDAERMLKTMATEPTIMIEPKNVNAFESANRLSIMMATNEDWVAQVAGDDRRYVVLDVSDRFKEDEAYFAALRDELESGGREAFLHDMLAMDLGNWHPRRDRPQTAALNEQKVESAEPLVEWIGDLLSEGGFPSTVRNAKTGRQEIVAAPSDPGKAKLSGLVEHARGYSKHLTLPKVREFIKALGASNASDGKGRYWTFPPLPEARQRFLDLYPWWPPFEDGQTEWGEITELHHRYGSDNPWPDQNEPAAE